MLIHLLPNRSRKQSFCLLILLYYAFSVNASTIDTWFEAHTGCTDAESCYEAAKQMYVEASEDSLLIFTEIMLHYAYAADKDEYIHASLTSFGFEKIFINELEAADSLINLAFCYAKTLPDFFDTSLNLADLQSYKGQPDSCIQILDDLLNRVGKDTMGIELGNFYYVRGMCYNDANKIANSIQDYVIAKKMLPPESSKIDAINYELSRFYNSLNSEDKILEFLTKSREESHADARYSDELVDYLNVMGSLRKLGRHKTSIQTGHEIIRLKNEHKVELGFGIVYYFMGDAFRQLNQRDSAWHYIEKGITYSREHNENSQLASNLFGKANLLVNEGKYKAAKTAMVEALSLRKYYDHELLDLYAKINATLGDYKTAHDALRDNWEGWQEKNSEEEMRKIAALLVEDKVELERKQERLNFEHQIQSQRQRNWLYLLGLFLTSALLLTYILVRNNRKLRELNESLVQRNTALEQFAYITSHDLKEPIRSISGFAGLLERNFKQSNHSEAELEYLAFIKDGARELYEIVESLKAFTDVAFTKVKLEDVPIDEVFASVQQNFTTLVQEKNGQLTFTNKHNINTVNFSKPMLQLALEHLVQNGFKHNESAHPQVNVEVTKKNNKVHFTVSDNGIGVEPEYFDKIFVPFKTLKNKTANRSAGLGLSICKNILENHGGKIWVESDGRNGSDFIFAI